MSHVPNWATFPGDRHGTEACLAALMDSSTAEIYLIDAATLTVLKANAAACRNLQYAPEEVCGMSLLALAPALMADHFDRFAAQEAPDGTHAGGNRCLQTEMVRRDGSRYPLVLQLGWAESGVNGRTTVLASGQEGGTAGPGMAALEQYKARFEAMVSNMPGLVYQFCMHGDGAISFAYLSEGCQALLGLSTDQLQRDPGLFLNLILPEDRKSYLDAMQVSASALWNWNWEGRIWVDAWKDVKWINLRATPRALQPAGRGVQWEGIMTNITESRLEHLEVLQSRARLAELTAHIEKVKEQERTRIAREIHDDLGGNLSAIKMALAMLVKRLPQDTVPLLEKAAYVDTLVDRTIDAVHRISLDLRPSMLDLGIVAALEWQSQEFERQTGIPCSFASNEKDIALDPDHATALFRIFQEALTNIAKHANATRVSVRMARLRQHISLKITDNGGGIWQSDRAKPQSFGLRGMAERASALGGTLTLGHAAGGGTVVTIKIRQGGPRQTIIAAAGTSPARREPLG